MLDIGPAATLLTSLLNGIGDDLLTAPTPCTAYRLGDLLDHVGGLTTGFTLAARKTPGSGGLPEQGDLAHLSATWRADLPGRLAALTEAWREPAAWTGTTRIGGIDLPGQVAGMIGLGELLVHSWDIARATGQAFPDRDRAVTDLVAAYLEFAPELFPPDSRPAGGAFGPAVPTPPGAGPGARLSAFTGREPTWSPLRAA